MTFCSLLSLPASPQSAATFTTKSLTPENALKAAQAALKKCRDDGYQVAVAVVDRSGVVQVVLRDRFAGPHTPDTAAGKAKVSPARLPAEYGIFPALLRCQEGS
jgi:hypothetical protein